MVGHKLDQLLTSLKLTPEEFSEKINVGKSTVYKLLRGDTKKLTRSMARKINEVFPQYSIDFLLEFNRESDKDAGEEYFEPEIKNDTKVESGKTLESLLGESVYKKVKPVLDELKNDNRKLMKDMDILRSQMNALLVHHNIKTALEESIREVKKSDSGK